MLDKLHTLITKRNIYALNWTLLAVLGAIMYFGSQADSAGNKLVVDLLVFCALVFFLGLMTVMIYATIYWRFWRATDEELNNDWIFRRWSNLCVLICWAPPLWAGVLVAEIFGVRL